MFGRRVFAMLVLLLVGLFAAAQAGEFKAGERVLVAPTDTVSGDLYAASRVVKVQGTAQHDVLAAGQRVDVSGSVKENLYATAQTVTISGTVGGDITAFAGDVEFSGVAESGIRAVGGTLSILGTVNGDVVLVGGDLFLGPDAVVNGDLIATGDNLTLQGTVHGMVKGSVDQLTLAGMVDHDVTVRIGSKLDLQPGASVGGKLVYKREQPLELANQEVVAGGVEYEAVEPESSVKSLWLGLIWFWLAALIVGFVLLALAKPWLQNTLSLVRPRWLPALGIGLATVIATPIVVVILLILVLTIPLGLILGVSYAVLGYLGVIFIGMLLGWEILRLLGKGDASLYWAMFIGLTLLTLLYAVPYVGRPLWLVAAVTGFGMIVMGVYNGLKKSA